MHMYALYRTAPRPFSAGTTSLQWELCSIHIRQLILQVPILMWPRWYHSHKSGRLKGTSRFAEVQKNSNKDPLLPHAPKMTSQRRTKQTQWTQNVTWLSAGETECSILKKGAAGTLTRSALHCNILSQDALVALTSGWRLFT